MDGRIDPASLGQAIRLVNVRQEWWRLATSDTLRRRDGMEIAASAQELELQPNLRRGW